MSVQERSAWMALGQQMVSEAAREAVEHLNQELVKEGFRMSVYVSCGFSFHVVPSGEVDRRFLERCGIKPDLEVKEP